MHFNISRPKLSDNIVAVVLHDINQTYRKLIVAYASQDLFKVKSTMVRRLTSLFSLALLNSWRFLETEADKALRSSFRRL